MAKNNPNRSAAAALAADVGEETEPALDPSASEVVNDLPPEAAKLLEEDEPDVEIIPVNEKVPMIAPTPAPALRKIRPSQVPEFADEAKKIKIDPFKWLKENGYATPTRLYRVTGRQKGGTTNAVEVEATDSSHAINLACKKLRIKHAHQWRFITVVLEE